VTTTFASAWTQASIGTITVRTATCQVPGCLDWTFLPGPGDVDAATA
jgi:hypothetical protein